MNKQEVARQNCLARKETCSEKYFCINNNQIIDEMLTYVWIHIPSNEIYFRASIIYVSCVIK